MPAATKPRRKAQPTLSTKSASITNFTRVSKTVGRSEEKNKAGVEAAKLEPVTSAARKRKAIASIEDDSSADEAPTARTASLRATKATSPSARRGRGRPSKKVRPEPAPAPSRKRVRSPSLSDSERSTVDAGTLFKKLRLESSPSRCSSPATVDTSIAGSETEADVDSSTLPDEVLDLIQLQASMLKTLTLQYAHNGIHVPVDLRVLCPNVARAWGKKKVTQADIRLCIGILNAASSPLFSLLNYGRGKICIEISQDHVGNATPLNENKLNDAFSSHLRKLWSGFATRNSPSIDDFLKSLPRASVTVCESVAKASPVLAKGQRRLEELRHGINIKKQGGNADASSAPTSSPTNSDIPMTNADGTKMSLLDRIRYKSLLKSNADPASAAGMTPAQIARRAALQRVVEIGSLMGMLSRSSESFGGRVSWPMNGLTQKLKDSLRMGVSREDGAAAVRLLATEVAPEWARVVRIGARENVVVETDCQPSKIDLEMRVRDLLAREG